jgi:hypothetical protein
MPQCPDASATARPSDDPEQTCRHNIAYSSPVLQPAALKCNSLNTWDSHQLSDMCDRLCICRSTERIVGSIRCIYRVTDGAKHAT